MQSRGNYSTWAKRRAQQQLTHERDMQHKLVYYCTCITARARQHLHDLHMHYLHKHLHTCLLQHKLEMIKQLRGFDIGELGSTEPWP